MTATSEKEDTQLRDTLCFLFVVCLCVVVALFTTTFPNHRRNCELITKAAALETEIEMLTRRNEHLCAQIAGLTHDPLYIEALARRKHRLVRPGEVLVESGSPCDVAAENPGNLSIR